MRKRNHIALLGLLICLFNFIPVLKAQTNKQKEEELNQIIEEAILNLYTNPVEVIQIGDSLYNNPSKDINEKVTGLLLMSDAFIAIRNYSKAHQYINIAKELLQKNISPSLKGKVLNRFAYQHFQLHLHDEALRYLNEAEVLNEMDTNDAAYLSNKGYINAVRGLVYRQLVGCDVAMRYFQRSIKAYEESKGELTKINLSIVYYNIGNCYITLQKYEEAKNSFDLAFYTADRYGSSRNSLKLFAKKGLASYYHITGQYQVAIDILNALNADAKKVGDKSLMRSIASDLASNYLEIENWTLYEKYNEEYKEINKELKDFEVDATMFALQDIDARYNSVIHKANEKFYKKIGVILLVSFSLILLILRFILKKRSEINIVRTKIFKTKN